MIWNEETANIHTDDKVSSHVSKIYFLFTIVKSNQIK